MLLRMLGGLFLTAALAFAVPATQSEIVLRMQLDETRAQLATAQAQLATAAKAGAQTVSAAVATRKAVEQLSTDTKTQATTSAIQATESHDAVQSVQEAANQIVDTSQATKLELAKLRATLPQNSAPVWLAAIAGIVSVVGVIGSIVLAFINKGKLGEIHTLANSNLATVTSDLKAANEKNAQLRELVQAHKSASTPPGPSNSVL